MYPPPVPTAPPSTARLPRRRAVLPFIGDTLGVMRDPIGFQRRGHRELGPLFEARVFSKRLVFVDPVGAPELLEEVVRAPTEALSMVEAYKELIGRIIGPELFIEVDAGLRHGLSLKHIRRHLGPTARYVPEAIAGHLPAAAGEIDGLLFANDLVSHVTAHYVLGAEATARRGVTLARLVHLLESDFSLLGTLLPIETRSARRRRDAFCQLVALVEDEVRARLAAPDGHDDFLAYAVTNLGGDPGRPAAETLRLLALRTLGVIFGAHTNTAMSIAATLLDLLEHPAVLADVRAEIDALDPALPLDPDALRRLERTYAAVNETLRRRSTGGIWRRAEKPLDLGGYTLPQGTLIGASMGLVNLDPARYPDPAAFRPERYATMERDGFQSPPVASTPLHFGAFGTGRGLCSGRPLAYTLIGLILVELLRGYEWQLVAKPRRWFTVLTGGLGRPIGGLRLRVRRRA